MKKMMALLAGAMLMMAAGSAMALPFNPAESRNAGFTFGSSSESNLQTVFNTYVTTKTPDVTTDQSTSAIWKPSDANQDAYLIKMISGAAGTLGVYSYANPSIKVDLLTLTAFADSGTASGGFKIYDNGSIKADNAASSIANFGHEFGFYWKANNTYLYTEDSKNTSGFGIYNNIRALAYQLETGATVTTTPDIGESTLTTTATGDDWILAFEDYTDGDFNDAVFYVEDIAPVPEPGTIILLGAGLAGLGLYGRRKAKK